MTPGPATPAVPLPTQPHPRRENLLDRNRPGTNSASTSCLSITPVAYADITLDWDDPDPDGDITHARIVRTSWSYGTQTFTTGSPGGFGVALLEPDTTYTFKVKLGTSANHFGPGVDITVTTLAIAAPTNVRVTDRKTNNDKARIQIEWDNPTPSTDLTSSSKFLEGSTTVLDHDGTTLTNLIRNVTLTPEADHTFQTWHRTGDEEGNFHEGPAASIDFTTSPLGTVNISDASDTEGGTLSFTVTLQRTVPSTTQQRVRTIPSLTQSDSAEPEDYSDQAGTLVFHPSPSQRRFELQAHDDDLCEGNETFTVELSTVADGGVVTEDGTGIGTIIDDEEKPLVSMKYDRTRANEGASTTSWFDTAPAAESNYDITLDYSGTATRDHDYTSPSNVTVKRYTKLACINQEFTDDDVYENTETLSRSSPSTER